MIITPEALGLGILFDRSPDAVIVAEAATGRVLLWSPGAARLFGHDPAEAVGVELAALGLEGLPLEGLGDRPVTHALEAAGRDGRHFPVEASVSAFPHPETGEPLALAIVGPRRAGPASSTQRDLVAQLLDNLPAGMALYGPDLRIRIANQAYARLFNRTLGDVIGKHVLEIFGPPGKVLEDVLSRILETGEPIHSLNLAGTYHYHGQAYEGVWDVTRNPVFDVQGRVEGVVVLMQDVTERARLNAEIEARTEELAEQKAMTERIVQHAPVMMAFLDRELVYRWNNPLHSEVMGIAPDQLIGRSVEEVLPEAALARTRTFYRRVIDSKLPQRLEGVPFAVRGGRQTYWDASYVPVLDDEGEVTGLLVLAVDATDRLERDRLQREQIAQLQQVDRMKDQFLSILSHELRTPLNAILGFASILDDEVAGSLSPNQHAYLAKILGGTEVLLALINDLLDMSRIQAGKFALQPGPLDLGGVVQAAVEHLASLIDRKGHALTIEAPASLPTIVGDVQRVEQVLVNLVGNAIKFTPEGGTIRVSACDVGDRLRVEVTDDGIGIPAEHMARLFQPFTQVDGSNTRAAGGTGLGLSISKALIEAHGGQIGVESTPGVGSTFWFTLPKQPGTGAA